MGGQSVPAATQSSQQQVTGWAAVPELKARALGLIDPALSNLHRLQGNAIGLASGDPNQTRAFFGLSPKASQAELDRAITRSTSGPSIQSAIPQTARQEPQTVQERPDVLPSKIAAKGGIMSLDDDSGSPDPRRSFAGGKSTTPKPLTAAQEKYLTNYANLKNPLPAQTKKAEAIKKQQATYTEAQGNIGKLADQGISEAGALINRAGYFGGAYDPTTNTFSVTNPYYNQAIDVLSGMNTQPEQFGQATGAYNQAIAGLQGAAGYTPQQVAAQNVAAQNIAAQNVTGATLAPTQDINAPTAQASSYNASQMTGPQNVVAQGYDAATMQGAAMQGAQDVLADRLQQYQMKGPQGISAERAQTAMMSGPESWAQPGVAQAYMNPYVKTALKTQQELANYDLQENLNKIMGQAAGAGAYGGSRTQLQLANTRMNQDLANRNMAAQALSQAYGQGMGQFQNESTLAQQAKGSNQAALNTAYNNYVAQQLAAQQANQGMDYNTALQNLQAKLGVQSTQQSADLQAALANQMYGTGGYQSQAQNLASLNQAAVANMQAINNQRSQYVTQALQAAQANQQAALTTEQQNMVARNAAMQFNAQNATQISQANAQMNLAAQQSNQQTAYNTAQQNAQLAQQANLANQQAGLTASQANQQAALNAALANQQAGLTAAQANQAAGLTANQQNIGALTNAAGAAQGLGALGTSVGNYNTNLANLWGQAGSTLQGLGSTYFDQMNKNAVNVMNAPGGFAGQGTGLLSGAGGTAGTTINTGTQGSAF